MVRSARTRLAHQGARIRQLCCLGLGSEAVVPALLKELHELVPSHGNSFFWADERGQLANVYDEHPESANSASLYLDEFYNGREREVAPTFSEAVRHQRGVLRDEQFLHVDMAKFFRSDFYNQVMRPIGYDRCVRLVVRENGITRGFLHLQRKRTDPAFDDVEIRILQGLQKFLGHCMTPRDASPVGPAYVDSGESGLLITDEKGCPVDFSPEGRRLLFLATHPRIDVLHARHHDSRLPSPLHTLCHRLDAIRNGHAMTEPPVLRTRNPWGVFVFRAYPLQGAASVTGPIGIIITRKEPLLLRLTRGAQALSLTPRQTQVAVLLASGLSYRSIAGQLGIKRNTAISHSRWIYERLGVNNSRDLRERLLESGAGRSNAIPPLCTPRH